MMQRRHSPARRVRVVVFLAVALGVPLMACNLFAPKATGDDAGVVTTPSASAVVATATATASSAAPVATTPPLGSSTTPPPGKPGPKVTVKLPDGGTAVVDATVAPDGAIQLPPAFQFPPIQGFDASVLKVPGFDAAAVSIPTTLPSGFPTLPGFGVDSGKK
jgi:hypothetical protein